MAHSLLMSLPGAVMVRNGDEIGMGDDLTQRDRAAVRTPTHWSPQRNAGFSTAPADRLIRPVIAEGPFDYPQVNVLAQQTGDHSLLQRISRMLRTCRGLRQIGNGPDRQRARSATGQIGNGPWQAVDAGPEQILAILHGDGPISDRILMLANLTDQDLDIALPDDLLNDGAVDRLADSDYAALRAGDSKIQVRGYGYRWMRLG
jgi:maltose alpha-D-glucosyltransferase/alpha-amylase